MDCGDAEEGSKMLMFPSQSRHPILLHKGHHLTKLVVRKAHKRVLHNGVKETLTEHNHNQGNADAAQVSVGDVVMVHSDDQPRGFWKLGRVEETVIGRDGEPQGAVL